MTDEVDIKKVLAYARIIDIQHEFLDLVVQTAKTTRRWNHRPTKTARGSLRRVRVIMAMAWKVTALAQEIRGIKHQLKSTPIAFVGGGTNNKPEIIAPLEQHRSI